DARRAECCLLNCGLDDALCVGVGEDVVGDAWVVAVEPAHPWLVGGVGEAAAVDDDVGSGRALGPVGEAGDGGHRVIVCRRSSSRSMSSVAVCCRLVSVAWSRSLMARVSQRSICSRL